LLPALWAVKQGPLKPVSRYLAIRIDEGLEGVVQTMFAGKMDRPVALLPPALPSGGTIGVIAPSSPVPHERLELGIAALRATGFEIVLGASVLERDGHHAGSPEARAADLHEMIGRADVDAIFCARGGSSAIQVLEHLDFELIRAHPKVLVGYSDVTSLLLALWKHAGLRSFFGPMVTPDWAAGLALGARDTLWRLVCRTAPAGPLADRRCATEARPLVCGRARGRLVGGTLALVAATLGTPEQIDLTDAVFFFEDIHESPARIERYLTQLGRAGLLERAAGFLVGPLRWDAEEEERAGYLAFETVLERQLAPLGRPALVGYPFGHVPNPITLPLGAMVEMDVDQQVLRALEPTVRESRK
jgi:muramoyltetrapeptide carboxypeptidase